MEQQYCVVLYDYVSPPGSDKLGLRQGERILVDNKEGNWWIGDNSEGNRGRFPSNYVRILEPDLPKCIALYEFAATKENHLSFKKDDVITVFSKEGAWWQGEFHGVTGRFPSNYVELLGSTPACQNKITTAPSRGAPPTLPPRASIGPSSPLNPQNFMSHSMGNTPSRQSVGVLRTSSLASFSNRLSLRQTVASSEPSGLSDTSGRQPNYARQNSSPSFATQGAAPPSPARARAASIRRVNPDVTATSSNDVKQRITSTALYDHFAANATQLSFRKGDVIDVLTQEGQWWLGRLQTGEEGRFPSNYIELNKPGAPPPPAPGGGSNTAITETPPASTAEVRCLALYDWGGSRPGDLCFAAGDILTVVSQRTSSWWEAELNGRRGRVPSNYVELIPADVPPSSVAPPSQEEDQRRRQVEEVDRRRKEEQMQQQSRPPHTPQLPEPSVPPPSPQSQVQVRALYDWTPTRAGQLEFAHGDIIKIISQVGQWWTGELRGITGRFPSNYVTLSVRTESNESDGAETTDQSDYLGILKATGQGHQDESRKERQRQILQLFNENKADGDGGSGVQKTRGPAVTMIRGRSITTDYVPPYTPDYEFSEEDTEDNLVWSSEATLDDRSIMMIRGTTLVKLMTKMTDPPDPGTNAIQAFLFTYKAYTTGWEVIDLLSRRFAVPVFCPAAYRELIEYRVYVFLREWAANFFEDFVTEPELVPKLQTLVDQIANSPSEKTVYPAGATLRSLIDVKMASAREGKVFAPYVPLPLRDPIHDVKKCNDFTDVKPEEFSRHLTMREFDLFVKIRPIECMGLGWMKKDSDRRAPNIAIFTKNFNTVAQWVTATILRSESVKGRQKLIKRFLSVAETCKEICNYNGMMEIVGGLGSRSIHRLHKTWTPKLQDQLKKYDGLMEANYKGMRALIKDKSPPGLPFIGIFLSDLTFIEEGNSDKIDMEDGRQLINWTKMVMMGSVIHHIRRWQQTGYNFTPVEAVRDYITNMTPALNDNEAYETSLRLEPRVRR